MSDLQPNPPPVFNPPPVPGNNSFYKILWVLAALIPTVFGIACLLIIGIANDRWVGSFLILDIICSIGAGIALVRGIGRQWLQVLMAFFLTGSFLVLNIFIVFIGCTEAVAAGGGR